MSLSKLHAVVVYTSHCNHDCRWTLQMVIYIHSWCDFGHILGTQMFVQFMCILWLRFAKMPKGFGHLAPVKFISRV